MSTRGAMLYAITALWLAGCATTKQQSAPDFELPEGSYELVVMRPDVTVSTLTARGDLESRPEWTSAARDHIQQSLRGFAQARGAMTHLVVTSADAGIDEAALLDLERLHGAVGASILEFKFNPMVRLPTKRHSFDWTLGELATAYGVKSDYEYALFVYARDSFASAGRNALRVASTAGCVFNALVCLIPTRGGQQVAFASLVDLRTGDVVWFNALHSSVGDIRTSEGAQKMMTKLLGPLAGGGSAQR
jgi:hypothetical protein